MAPYAPEFFVTFVEHLKTRDPRNFNEKIRYKMARDRRPILTLFADKFRVRDVIADRVGTHVLTTMYDSASNANLINWSSLPREFVAKVNHGSGGVIVVSEAADPPHRLPANVKKLTWTRFFIHPDSLDYELLALALNRWLSVPFGQQKLLSVREWGYKNIPPRVLVEEYIGTPKMMPAQIDVICIHGRPEELQYYPADTTFEDNLEMRYLREEFESARLHLDVPEKQWHEMLTWCESIGWSPSVVSSSTNSQTTRLPVDLRS